jgi:hemerythrin superfamily protein
MSIFDKVVAAVTPPESEQARAEARSKAQSAATAGDWLSMVLDHHVQIEEAFEEVRAARDAASRRSAQKRLAIILTGHSIAEESVLYPALAAQADEKGHATMAYTQQAGAKLEMAELENLAPMSQDYIDKLEHIRGAVAHHVYEEEGTWFLEIKEKLSAEAQVKLTERYQEEFERYVGDDAEDDWSDLDTRSATVG